ERLLLPAKAAARSGRPNINATPMIRRDRHPKLSFMTHQDSFTPVLVVPKSPPTGGDKHSPADGCDQGAFIVK
ncbi:MAG: hypothetical protein NTW99_14645, partial [Chloroflexi bacterium]|nr:hypothetical protein [Chloroflexota bacterium]